MGWGTAALEGACGSSSQKPAEQVRKSSADAELACTWLASLDGAAVQGRTNGPTLPPTLEAPWGGVTEPSTAVRPPCGESAGR